MPGGEHMFTRASLPPGKGVGIFLLLQKFKLRDWTDHPKNVIALHLKYNLTAKIMRKMRIRMIYVVSKF